MDSCTIKDALKKASLILNNQKEAAILLAYHLQKDRLYLITHEENIVKECKRYFSLIQRRKDNEPIEYITNSVSFYDSEFFITKGALIPRPETELLIDKAKDIITKDQSIKNIAEIGTGSGIIAVMLVRLFKDITVTATDINKDALDIAKKNASDFGVSERINFVHTSYLDEIYEKFDMIISNPPYIQDGFELEKPLFFEPQNALFGGEKGDEILREIILLAKQRDSKYLLCEMGYDQKAPLEKFMNKQQITDIEFYQDYSSFDRGFVAKLKE